MNRLLRLSCHDMANILRDPVHLYIMASPFIIAGAIRWLLPYLETAAAPYMNLPEYYDLIAGMLLIITPILIGALSGFIFLDEKDEGTSMVAITTPLGRSGYILYRLLSPTLLAFLLSFIILPILPIIKFDIAILLPLTIMAAFEAPISALFISLLAGNKVEGIAVAKGLMLFLFIPVAGYFFHSGFKLLLGIFPFFWPVHTYLIQEPSKIFFWKYMALGFTVHILWLACLARLFMRKLVSG